MSIKMLSPQLANQIAAGEVVERPASVVKELIENSLDAGATQIFVDIENGGANLIRVRDNGIGIPKTELNLALARHATSKIQNLEDLENILSLGFRGEALASISSVSRLTLTSRPAEQSEAWQVRSEGVNMQPIIEPAAHPVGTTVEVANLFFNTPARRKFLKSAKTEFAHLDEVLRRIVLAKPNLNLTLSHNGKTLRQYRTIKNQDPQQRIANICGTAFIQDALHLDWQHAGLHLHGWINFNPNAKGNLQYSYVNGRMVKDKVMLHAIRQAYASLIENENQPDFVLFLELAPSEVDVNVHPTKHEVRFQQARLVHDFIYQGVADTLSKALSRFATPPLKSENFAELVGVNTPSKSEKISQNSGREVAMSNLQEPCPNFVVPSNRRAAGTNIFTKQVARVNQSVIRNAKIETALYEQLVATPTNSAPISLKNTSTTNTSLLKALSLLTNALLLQRQADCYLLSIQKLQQLQLKLQLKQAKTTPLLIPVSVTLTATQYQVWQNLQPILGEIGFQILGQSEQKRIRLTQVPSCLREQNLQQLMLKLLQRNAINIENVHSHLLTLIESKPIEAFCDAVSLLNSVEQSLGNDQTALETLLIKLDLQPYLEQL